MEENKLYDSDYLLKLHGVFENTKRRSYELLNPLAEDTIIDVGCGNGQDVVNLAISGAKVYGIDNDQNFISIANELVTGDEKIKFICCEADNIPLLDSSIDKIRLDRVLQHIADHNKVLKEISRLLKPNGLLQVIDTDYLSMSLFLEDEKLERKIVDAVSYKRIPNGHKVRQLVKTLEQNNFYLLKTEIHNYVISDYEFAKSLLRFDKVFDEELECGNISLADYELWQRHIKGQFNLSINLILLIARQNKAV